MFHAVCMLQAVIRRMPRRLLVDLPDGTNRAKVAQVCTPPPLPAAEIENTSALIEKGNALCSGFRRVFLATRIEICQSQIRVSFPPSRL